MKVLSLFDGISVCQHALRSLSFPIEEYTASEIEPNAIKTTQRNYPTTIQAGSVVDLDFTKYKNLDLLTAGSPCFVAGTKVVTLDDFVSIENIKVGDYVLTHENRYRKVLAVGGKTSETIIIKAQGVKPTETTVEHPYYVSTSSRKHIKVDGKSVNKRMFSAPYWKTAGELKKGDFLCFPINKESRNILDLTMEECYILGRYIADGHTRKDLKAAGSRHWQLILSIGDSKLDDFKSRISENHYSCLKHTTSVHRVIFSNKRLVEIAEKYCRSGAENKIFPKIFIDLPIDMLKNMLDGYMSGDGSCRDEVYKANSVSEDLIISLQHAISKVYRVNSSYEYTERPKTHIIEGRTVNQRDTFGITFRKEMKKSSNAYVEGEFIYLPFKESLETNTTKQVYNLEVEEDNSYTANNVIVHNCQNFSVSSSRKGMIASDGTKITALTQYLALKDSGEAFEGESYLFWEFVRGLHETKPKYFMLENVEMPDEWYDLLCSVLGDYYASSPNFDPELENFSHVNGNNLLIPFEINASKFSAQSRKRLYWTNIPVDSHALAIASCDDTLAIIMQPNIPEKYFYKQAFEHRTESRNHAILEINGHDILKRVYYPDQKCPTLTRVSGGNQQKKVIDGARARKLTPQEYELAQGLPLDYTKGISDTARYCALGNSWCSPVIQFIFRHIPTKL